MKVRVYIDGCEDDGHDYADYPAAAVQHYAREWLADENYPQDVVVVPLDEEAKALPGWNTDDDGAYRQFAITPMNTWASREVEAIGRSAK